MLTGREIESLDDEQLAGAIPGGWFVESIATQTLVIYVVRTRRVPFQSPQVQLFRRAPQVELKGGCASSGGWWLEFGVPGAARSRRLILFVFDGAGGLR